MENPVASLVKLLGRRWRSLLLVTIALLLGWQLNTPAQSTTQLEARLSRLESENTLLQSRLSRLENGASRPSPSPPAQTQFSSTPTYTATTTLADDPTFKRLATLVIELRDRIITLETQNTQR